MSDPHSGVMKSNFPPFLITDEMVEAALTAHFSEIASKGEWAKQAAMRAALEAALSSALAAAEAKGFAAGVEAAAQRVTRSIPKEASKDFAVVEHGVFCCVQNTLATAIRALRPPAAPADDLIDRVAEMPAMRKLLSEPAGAPSEEDVARAWVYLGRNDATTKYLSEDSLMRARVVLALLQREPKK